MRRLLAVTALCLLAALVGCGGGVRQADEERAARGALQQFLMALGRGDGAAACARAAASAQALLAERAGLPGAPCPLVVERAARALPPSVRAALEGVRVGRVEVRGRHASVATEAIASPAGDLGPFLHGARPQQLVEQGGRWLLTG